MDARFTDRFLRVSLFEGGCLYLLSIYPLAEPGTWDTQCARTASGMDDSEKGNRQVRSARGHPLLWKSLYEGLLQLEQDQGEG